MPLWKKILWAIPKNLVYIFVCVILFAFIGMLYVTYFDKNLTEFLSYDRSHEVVVVAPVYKQLKKSMVLDKYSPAEERATLDVKTFNRKYLLANRPVKVKELCLFWGATQKWTLEYLKEQSGDATSMTAMVSRSTPDIPWNRSPTHLRRFSHSLGESIDLIQSNANSSRHQEAVENAIDVAGDRSFLYFLYDDMLRAPELRPDYDFPPLHKFMRLQRTSISIIPQELRSVEPV